MVEEVAVVAVVEVEVEEVEEEEQIASTELSGTQVRILEEHNTPTDKMKYMIVDMKVYRQLIVEVLVSRRGCNTVGSIVRILVVNY